MAHCGFLKGPASNALRQQFLGKLAGRGNGGPCFIRADLWTFCSRNILEASFRAESWTPPQTFQESRTPHFKKVFLILKPLKFKLGRLAVNSRLLTYQTTSFHSQSSSLLGIK